MSSSIPEPGTGEPNQTIVNHTAINNCPGGKSNTCGAVYAPQVQTWNLMFYIPEAMLLCSV
jgi:hypothetical protein